MKIYYYKCVWAKPTADFKKGKTYHLIPKLQRFVCDNGKNYFMVTRNSLDPNNWDFVDSKFERAEQKITFKKHGNTVMAKMGNKKGAAKCHQEDTFDYYTGCRIALDRLFNKELSIDVNNKEKEKDEEGEVRFKPGDLIKFNGEGIFYTRDIDFFVDLYYKKSNAPQIRGWLGRFQYSVEPTEEVFSIEYISPEGQYVLESMVEEDVTGFYVRTGKIYLSDDHNMQLVKGTPLSKTTLDF